MRHGRVDREEIIVGIDVSKDRLDVAVRRSREVPPALVPVSNY
jgi:hypothetical protein